MKKNLSKVLTLILALAMVLGVMTMGASAAFTDDEQITYKEAVGVAQAIGVINGYPDGSYDPDGLLDRAGAAKLICYLLLTETSAEKLVGSGNFSDVPTSHWAAGCIDYCVSKGYIAGMGDGTYLPDRTLTQLEFGKLLLCALGYDAKIEGYEGKDWATNIGVDMATAGLVVDGVALDASLTREAAAQMILQALQATTVYYNGGKGSEIKLPDGTTVVINAGTLTKVDGSGADYAGRAKNEYKELCEALYPTLKLTSASNSDFNRPASMWTYTVSGTTKTVVAEQTPAAVYTTAVKGGKIYSDLGLTKTPQNTQGFVNGTLQESWTTMIAPSTLSDDPIKANGQNQIGGNGVITEVYKLADDTLRIVQIQYTLGYVNNVVSYAATSAVGAHTTYTIDGVELNSNVVYVDNASQIGTYKVFSSVVNKDADKDTAVLGGAIAKDTYVLVVADAVKGMTYIYPAATISGNLTASSASTYTIGGTAYNVANVKVAGGAAAFNAALYSTTTATTFVVDSYGNVVAPIKTAAQAPTYVYVVYQEKAYTLAGTTLVPSITAYAVDTTGAIVTMSVSKVGTTAVKNSGEDAATQLPDGLYSYKLETDGTYTFTKKDDTTISSGFNYATSAEITSGIYGNANTVFYTINVDKNTDKPVSVTTTTGMANMGNVTAANGAYIATKNVADYVFLTTATARASAKVVYYGGDYSFDGKEYTFNVITNGVADTVKNDSASYLTLGLSSIDDKGTVTPIKTAAEFSGHTGTYTADGKTYGLTNNGGLLSVVETDVSTGVVSTTPNIDTIASNVPVYVISASNNTCTTTTAGEMSVSGASLIYIQANANANGIGAIYVIG